MRDPLIRRELKKAAVWIGMALAVVAVIVLAQPLLLIFGGVVFAAILDGGTRLLGRVLPIGRGWRLLIISLLALPSSSARSGSRASSSPRNSPPCATSSRCRSTACSTWPRPMGWASKRSSRSRCSSRR